jgi:hypothetical protein
VAVERRRYQLRLHRLPVLHARPVVQRGEHTEQQHADPHAGKRQRKQREKPGAALSFVSAMAAHEKVDTTRGLWFIGEAAVARIMPRGVIELLENTPGLGFARIRR